MLLPMQNFIGMNDIDRVTDARKL
jgi:predicted P-loop ATPase